MNLVRRFGVRLAAAIRIALAPALACALFPAPATALATALATPPATPLAPEVRHALARAHVPARGAAFLVVPLDGGALRLTDNATAPMHPASTMKLLTTWAALGALGPGFRWRTEAWGTGTLQEGVLSGDLVLRGGGDPSLVIERWWLLLAQLRALGVREIRGDLVVDRGAYAAAPQEATIDGDALRPYNVAPDAMLVNYRAVRLRFDPVPAAGVARVLALPAPAALHLPATVPLAGGACGDWHGRLGADFSRPASPVFRGGYPASCGARDWHLALLAADEYLDGVFREAWSASGGALQGRLRHGTLPREARLLATQESPPLTDIVRDINKNSNNVMARQLFLALGGCEEAGATCSEYGRWAGGAETAPDPGAEIPWIPPQVDPAQVDPEAPPPAAPGPDPEPPGEAPPESPPEAPPAPQGEPGPPPPGGDETGASPAAPAQSALSTERSSRFLRAWLARAGLPMPGLVLENGSGLSRREAIRPVDLAAVLGRAWKEGGMPDFVGSLPHAGVDGTMKSRIADVPGAWIKTGMLADARAVAGYVFAASGKRYAVVGIVNGRGAGLAQPALDAFLRWVWRKG